MRRKFVNGFGIIGVVISLCFNLSACQNTVPSQPESTPQTKTIALTTDNIKEYLFIEDETQNYYVTESPFLPGTPMQEGHADCVINIGKAVPCELYNVVITLEIQTIGFMWYNDDMTITLNVPADGSLAKRITIDSGESILFESYASAPTFIVFVKDVSGEVKVPA